MAGKKKPTKPEVKRKRRQKSETADWATIEPELLSQLIQAVTKGDGAIRFGYRRDGGAYAIGIYGDGKPYVEYFPAGEGVVNWVEGITYDFE